jgi:uncharacterized membrane protein
MNTKAAITVLRSLEEIDRLWREPRYRLDRLREAGARVTFVTAPGNRGSEIHVELPKGAPAGKLGEAMLKLLGAEPLARVKDDLRHFKQLAETGLIARSEGSPEGESLVRKLWQRPARPLAQDELEKVGV